MTGRWRQLLARPSGTLPGNVVAKAGVGAVAVLLVGLVLSQSGRGPQTDGAAPAAEADVVGQGAVGQLRSRLAQLREERRIEEGRRARAARAAAAAIEPAEAAPAPAAAPPAPDGTARTAGEEELLERLRLESIERRARSLRAAGVVQTARRGRSSGTGAAARPPAAPRVAAPAPQPAAGRGAREGALPAPAAVAREVREATSALDAALRETLGAGAAVPPPPAGRTVPGVTGPPVAPAPRPAAVETPADPPGWERVYEGSVLSAVLVTQLSGDFAGPVLAQVAIPLYSADRQRVLVPRGTRLLGAAEAVRQQDQSRLAVGFHRMVWPDGRWVALAFHGLNALGESALRDQVNRHYASTFAAAGAVGVLSGLTLRGADPYAGGAAGFRAGAGQGLGQSATQILDRFLNRLPTVTIRAGHRLRVWITTDFLVPRPAPQPEGRQR